MRTTSFIPAVVLLFLHAATLSYAMPSCPPGTFIMGSTCKDCPPGTHQYQSNERSCTPCEAGTFNAFPGAQGPDLCRRCPANTFSQQGAASCTPCPPGTVSEEWAPRCLACGPGTELNFRSCSTCPRGSYSEGAANVDCTQCPDGFTTEKGGTTSAADCVREPPPDCVINGTACEDCDRGQFYNFASRSCDVCPAGTFSAKSGSVKCTPCPPGTFGAFSFSSQCARCPSGTSNTQSGAILCKIDNFPCPSNHFEDNLGRCMKCLAGSRLDIRSKTCKPCGKNTWSRGGAVTQCFRCREVAVVVENLNDCLCEPGRFPTVDGRCEKCPKGTSRGSADAGPLCQRCFFGSISDKTGAVKCTVCPKGTFQPKEGQTKCMPCPPGTVQKPFSFGRECVSTRTNCPLGFKRVQRGPSSFRCEQDPCPPGTFRRIGENGPECASCPPGTKFIPSSKQCMRCEENEISNGGVVTSCTRCPNGLFRYKPEGNNCRCIKAGYGLRNGKCEICPPGTFSVYYKNTCTLCPTGTFASGTGTYGACRVCPKNKFADERGSSSCKPCPAGTVTYGLGEANCVRSIGP